MSNTAMVLDLRTVFRAGTAVIRANMKCLALKMFHAKNFKYSFKTRIYPRVEMSIRKGGSCEFGSNLKIETDAQVATFGGNLRIGDNVGIGKRNIIGCQEKIEIGDGTTLGPNVLIYDHDHEFEFGTGVKQKEYRTSPVKIGKNVWIGANNVILRGTTIGDNCVIAAGGGTKRNLSSQLDYSTEKKYNSNGNAKASHRRSGGDKMSVLVSTDFSVWKCQDRVYTKFAFSSIIKRYSEDLGTLSLCCPVKIANTPPEGFIDITDIVENLIPANKLKSLLHLKNKNLENAIKNSDIVLGRFPGFIPMFVSGVARKLRSPRFSEVMGCGWDAYWNHGLLGKIVAPYVFFGTRKALKKSEYALYVTEEFLQNRYPCDNRSVGVSDVVIPDIDLEIRRIREEKIANMESKELTLMTCAAVNVWYKGQHFVIKAIPELNKKGIRVKYYCVGQGEQDYLKKIAKECGVEDQVVFTGAVSHDKIFELLDECDIYIQPSLQEGLPRALVEAMSRGCPAVGAKTGGIPELIPDECVVRRKSVNDISETILTMLKKGLSEYSEKSFQRAGDFQKNVLDKRRNDYFEYVKTSIN